MSSVDLNSGASSWIQRTTSYNKHRLPLEDKPKFEQIENLSKNICLRFVKIIPVIGLLATLCFDCYLKYRIRQEEGRIELQIIIRKTAIDLLNEAFDIAVIQSIAFTILCGAAAFLSTGSLYSAIDSSGYLITGFYTAMTVPIWLAKKLNKYNLDQEIEKREIEETAPLVPATTSPSSQPSGTPTSHTGTPPFSQPSEPSLIVTPPSNHPEIRRVTFAADI